MKKTNNLILNPWWLTGFCDAESCFMISICRDKEYACGWQVQASFTIVLHKKDLPLLVNIKNYLGVGIIYIRGDNLAAIYKVSSLFELTNVIIPHFTKYPLLTQKKADFLLFKEVVELMSNKFHLTMEGLQQIINIRASMNKGLPDTLKSEFSEVSPVERPLILTESIPDSNWVAGFVSGEGNFSVKIHKSERIKIKYQVQLRFRISQHERDTHLMETLIKYLEVGKIEEDCRNPVVNLTVVKFSDITNVIIPFFDKNPILGVKLLDYQDWCRIAKLMSSGSHLTMEGLELIRSIKAKMNTGR